MNESVPTGITNHLDLSYLVRRESPGIHATAGSLVHTASVIENHHHRLNRLFGPNASPIGETVAGAQVPFDTLDAYHLDALGTSTPGAMSAPLLLLGSDDTATGEFINKRYYDAHLIYIVGAAHDGTYILQLAHDPVSIANAYTNKTYSVESFTTQSAASRRDPISINIGRIPVGDKLWVRGVAKGAVGDKALDFFLGVHFYENGTP